MDSPLRILQRFGRTGRQREGRCVTLAIEGDEVRKYETAMKNMETVRKCLSEIPRELSYVARGWDPRMIPEGIQPTEMLIDIGDLRNVRQQTAAASKTKKRKEKADEATAAAAANSAMDLHVAPFPPVSNSIFSSSSSNLSSYLPRLSSECGSDGDQLYSKRLKLESSKAESELQKEIRALEISPESDSSSSVHLMDESSEQHENNQNILPAAVMPLIHPPSATVASSSSSAAAPRTITNLFDMQNQQQQRQQQEHAAKKQRSKVEAAGKEDYFPHFTLVRKWKHISIDCVQCVPIYALIHRHACLYLLVP